MGVVTIVLSLLLLLTALAVALFTCVVSGWAWHGGLTLCMRVVCILSSSSLLSHRLSPSCTPVVHPPIHIHLLAHACLHCAHSCLLHPFAFIYLYRIVGINKL